MTKDQLNTLFDAWKTMLPEGIPLPACAAAARPVFCILSQLATLMHADAPDVPNSLTPQLLAAVMPHVPDSCLSGDTLFDHVKDTLSYLYEATKSDTRCAMWQDAQTGSPVFHPTQGWRREAVHHDLRKAWGYLGLSMTFLG